MEKIIQIKPNLYCLNLNNIKSSDTFANLMEKFLIDQSKSSSIGNFKYKSITFKIFTEKLFCKAIYFCTNHQTNNFTIEINILYKETKKGYSFLSLDNLYEENKGKFIYIEL